MTSPTAGPAADLELTAQMEPFDSFWEGPEDVDKGYTSFFEFSQE